MSWSTKLARKILLIFPIFILLFLANPKPSYAQATCTCDRNLANFCVATQNCPSGYNTVCSATPLTSCDGSATSCACIPIGVSPSTSPTCGAENQSCCPGSICNAGLNCWSQYGQPPRCMRTCSTVSDCSPGEICSYGVCSVNYFIVPPQSNRLFCDRSGNPTVDPSSGKLYTAIGCIPVNNPDSLIGFILQWTIGIGGGIAFILIIIAGFQIMSSSGNPERIKAGQELLTSAVTGIILLIFSIFILELIGVKILNIPGFNTGP